MVTTSSTHVKPRLKMGELAPYPKSTVSATKTGHTGANLLNPEKNKRLLDALKQTNGVSKRKSQIKQNTTFWTPTVENAQAFLGLGLKWGQMKELLSWSTAEMDRVMDGLNSDSGDDDLTTSKFKELIRILEERELNMIVSKMADMQEDQSPMKIQATNETKDPMTVTDVTTTKPILTNTGDFVYKPSERNIRWSNPIAVIVKKVRQAGLNFIDRLIPRFKAINQLMPGLYLDNKAIVPRKGN